MDWIRNYQLFLFDFDGLLVSTEHIHYQAYMNMLRSRGCDISWDFSKFCSVAHLNAKALREAIYLEFPDLDPDFGKLYKEKQKIYFDLITSGKIELMQGAKELLDALAAQGIQRCVVTNSFLEQIEVIRSQNEALQSIPHWITREDYENPKPDPEGYLLAISKYASKGDRVIGFEDSVRGFEALKKTPATPVLIANSKPLSTEFPEGTYYFDSLANISLP